MIDKKGTRQGTAEKIFCIASVIFIVAFFIISIFLMTKTGEDILHSNTTEKIGLIESISRVYNSIPRLGEFLQRSTIQFFDYQITWSDFLLRTFDVIMCTALIYLCTLACVGRRPRLQYKDVIIANTAFIAIAATRYNETFMARFSYLHNYIPILILLATSYTLIFRIRRCNYKTLAIATITGVLLGFSNELTPVAILLIGIIYIISAKIRQRLTIKELFNNNKMICYFLIGLTCGFIFLLSSGAILSRGSGAYGEAYDYVSPLTVLKDPVYVIAKYLKHFLYNGRNIFALVATLIIVITVEIIMIKKRIVKDKTNLLIQIYSLLFVLLFLLGSSQILVLDDLEPRFMSPAFLALLIPIIGAIYQYMEILNIRKTNLLVALLLCVVFSLAMIADRLYASIDVYKIYNTTLLQIKNANTTTLCLDQELETIIYSPIFGFYQYSAFEPWTNNYSEQGNTIFGKNIYYTNDCPQEEN